MLYGYCWDSLGDYLLYNIWMGLWEDYREDTIRDAGCYNSWWQYKPQTRIFPGSLSINWWFVFWACCLYHDGVSPLSKVWRQKSGHHGSEYSRSRVRESACLVEICPRSGGFSGLRSVCSDDNIFDWYQVLLILECIKEQPKWSTYVKKTPTSPWGASAKNSFNSSSVR